MFDHFPKNYCFNDVIKDNTKYGFKFNSNEYCTSGEVAIIDQGEQYICGYKQEECGKKPYEKESIIFGDHTECFKFVNFPFYLGADGVKILNIVDSSWNYSFVFNFLKNEYHPQGGYSRHFKFLKEICFSKPPLTLQNEFAKFARLVDKSKVFERSKQ